MIVIVRLDLDRYDLRTIERLVQNGVITVGEATESKSVRDMQSDVKILMWVRKQQRARELLAS